MKKIKIQMYFKWAIAVILLVTNFNLYPLVWVNGSGKGYEGVGSIVTTNTIESYIIDGAGFYLNAKSDVEKLLRLIELQDSRGLEYKELDSVVDNAIVNMKNAIGTYESLIQNAENLPYNEDVQNRLKTFDYAAFMLSNELNKNVFDAVSGFLKYGDITGCFKKSQANMNNILVILKTVKDAVSLNRKPDLSILWRLNETCCETSLFGSYVTRVFFAIR